MSAPTVIGHTGSRARASDLVLEAVNGEGERISAGEIVDALDARAFGLASLLFSLPSVVPMPPGVPTIVGFALLLVSLQMIAGLRSLWLPGSLRRASFSRASLVAGLRKVQPWLARLEKIARPRFLWMTSRAAERFAGLIILVMAIVLILPLPPGGNFPPALAVAVIGVGLIERDGLIVGVGFAASIAALAVAYYLAVLGLRLAGNLLS